MPLRLRHGYAADIQRGLRTRRHQPGPEFTMRAATQPKFVRLDPMVVANLVRPAATGPVGRLERRELNVLELMAQGLANTPTANRLVISERTVEAHICHILTKLDISERRGRPSSCACCFELPPTAHVALAPTGRTGVTVCLRSIQRLIGSPDWYASRSVPSRAPV